MRRQGHQRQGCTLLEAQPGRHGGQLVHWHRHQLSKRAVTGVGLEAVCQGHHLAAWAEGRTCTIYIHIHVTQAERLQ